MKKTIISTVLLLNYFNSVKSQTENFIDQPYIEVSGSSDTLVVPNEIFIKIILTEKDSKDRQSIEELETKMLNALKDLSINTTLDLSISDILSNYHNYLFKPKEILRTKEYLLKVKSGSIASKVFIKLEEAGIAHAEIDHVNHTETEKFVNNCRAKAILDAKNKAQFLTKAINQTIGKAIFIEEQLNLETSENNGYYNYKANNSINVTSMDKFGSEVKIDFEKIKITQKINVVFVLN